MAFYRKKKPNHSYFIWKFDCFNLTEPRFSEMPLITNSSWTRSSTVISKYCYFRDFFNLSSGCYLNLSLILTPCYLNALLSFHTSIILEKEKKKYLNVIFENLTPYLAQWEKGLMELYGRTIADNILIIK